MLEKDDCPEISVIVAVYNAERYLSVCVDSILGQTYANYEVLLIDDGSTDASGWICDKYACKDKRVRVFHKSNGGVSSARNVGIQEAKGKYSIHVDSDDWIESGMLERLYKKAEAEKADVVIADFLNHTNQRVSLKKQKPKTVEARNVLKEILRGKLHGSMWNKLVRHELYQKNAIHFDESINCCEDVLVVTQLLLQHPNVAYLPEAFYHYIYNPVSIVRNLTHKTFNELFGFVEEMQKLFDGDPDLLGCLIYTKLTIRKDALFSRLYTQQEYKGIYKEADSYICRATFPLIVKLLLWIAAGRGYWIVEGVVGLRNFIRRF
ncbi:glycosyltransferase family 2 protein [Odoribacter lunatus]|uniref:glycosyltransferase family 2 protein n=1 Tax=Odoribacter lunatus TaxID=2941335 RepID=UPI00203E8D7E|nr:glycosyltransferase [Odoribacter lunatus]